MLCYVRLLPCAETWVLLPEDYHLFVHKQQPPRVNIGMDSQLAQLASCGAKQVPIQNSSHL